MLARYLSNPEANKEDVFNQLRDLLSDLNASQSKTLIIIAATLYLHEDNHKEAYRILKEGTTLEQCVFVFYLYLNTSNSFISFRHALLVQMHLKIQRPDLAQKQLAKMKAIDEDSVLTMLCNAWLHISNVSIC